MGLPCFHPVLATRSLLTGYPGNSRAFTTSTTWEELQRFLICESLRYWARAFYNMVTPKTREPQDFESTAVFSQDLSFYIWDFVDDSENSKFPPTAALLA